MTGRIVNQIDLAAFFGVTTKTVRAWEGQGCPVERVGAKGRQSAYDTAAVLAWRERRASEAATTSAIHVDIEEARRRKVAAEAALAERELARLEAEYVAVADVGPMVAAEYAVVRDAIGAIPAEMARDLEGLDAAVIEELLASKVTEVLTALSEG